MMQMIINEGGNVTGTVKKTKENTRAQKIPIKEIGRQEFIKKSLELFHNINQRFEKKFGEKLWKKEDELTSGFMFNGSTSFIMDPKLTDDEVISVKPSAGDFDIAIPEEHKENLWDLLDELEDKDLIPGVTYKGSNKPQKSSIGEQINTVFIMDFPNGVRAYAQVDFEALPFENDSPTEWAKFSHSSSFDDATIKVKAVFHKYIIRSLASSVSMRDDIVIATPASTKEKYKLKKVQEDDIPRMLKFSVSRGIRTAYEPLGIKDPDSGKEIYKEMKTTESNYTTIVADIYGLVFGDVEKNPGDVKLFNSFKGIVELMKKKLNKKQIDDSIFRLEQLLWDEKMGQELEVDDAKTDFDVKIAGYNYLMKELGRKMSPKTEKMLEIYYKDYGRRKSFVAENNNSSFDDLKKDLFKFIRESKEQLDISILSAKKYLSSTAKIQKFFETPVLIEHKTDGVKISVIYTGNEEKPWIFAYKGMIIYDGEFEYASKPALKKSSISNSQFQIILDHFKKIPFEKISNFPGLRANHEFFIEFLMRKPTLSSNYHKSHGMVLIAHSPTKWKERFGRLISRPIDFITEDRNDFAKLLKIDVPQVLFKGILGSDNMFQNGIENSELKSLYAQQSKSFNWSNYEILLNQVQELFLTVESKYGGKEEGVVVKYLDGSDVLIKFQQDYQVDQNARAQIKDKWKGTPEEEDAYFKQVRLVALEIINQMNLTVKRPLQDFLQIASGLLKDQKLSIQHPIKDKINIQDDIYNTMKMIITKKMKGNNGALYLGKFRVLSSAHYKIIKDAIAVYDHVVVALVSSAETKDTRDLRERMLKAAFPTLEIVHANSGNLFTIINKASSNINVVLAGSDRVAAYSKMLEKNPDIRVREIKRTDEDVSATKIVKAIKEDNFELFKSMTPKEIHAFYNELKNVYGLGTTIKEILKENELTLDHEFIHNAQKCSAFNLTEENFRNLKNKDEIRFLIATQWFSDIDNIEEIYSSKKKIDKETIENAIKKLGSNFGNLYNYSLKGLGPGEVFLYFIYDNAVLGGQSSGGQDIIFDNANGYELKASIYVQKNDFYGFSGINGFRLGGTIPLGGIMKKLSDWFDLNSDKKLKSEINQGHFDILKKQDPKIWNEIEEDYREAAWKYFSEHNIIFLRSKKSARKMGEVLFIGKIKKEQIFLDGMTSGTIKPFIKLSL